MSAPRATVRLQLHAGFTFDDARAQVGYYAGLGISHYYVSPILASRRGSTHGYDGVDPTRIDDELGGEAGFAALVEALHAHDMGLIVDIVPNHLAVGSENPWWRDLLAHGRHSAYAHCFDIDWDRPGLDGKLLLPFLGDRYAAVLESGDLRLVWDDAEAAFAIAYHEHRFPIAPADAMSLIAAPTLPVSLDAGHPLVRAALVDHDPRTSAGRQRLHALLEQQAYRLTHWRSANDALNWRRFFDITELAGVRVEDESVFDLSHAYLLSLVERGWIDGLRIDHVDGLADPRGYCLRLRARLDAIAAKRATPCYLPIYVEKILGAGESLHEDWGIDGTTGYEFLDRVSGVQHDPAGREPWARAWHEISGRPLDFEAEVELARGETLNGVLTAEFERCVAALSRLAAHDVVSREFSPPAIRRVLAALAIAYPVYRSYADRQGRPAVDAPVFARARAAAQRALSAADAAWLQTVDEWLGGQPPDAFDHERAALRLEAIARFQQLTSPLAAKSVEDTAGYRSALLLSRNDVGCEGAEFSYATASLHDANRERLLRFPLGMLTTATHDHKRGEDARARLAAMSESATTVLPRLREWVADERLGGAAPAPSGGDRLLLLQIVLAAWPLDMSVTDASAREAYAERLIAWQQKAMREAKLESHWLAPDEAYEQAGADVVRRALAGDDLTLALAEVASGLDLPGAINGLAQTTLRLCSPGVPDLYQGTEFWDQTLVDPDNRRAVDMDTRARTLALGESPVQAWRHWRDGVVKQSLIASLLTLRREDPALFRDGDYVALNAAGERAAHVIAWARRTPEATLVVIVPRQPMALMTGDDERLCWGDTWLDLTPLSLAGQGYPVLTAMPVEDASALPLEGHLGELPVGAWLWRA